MIRHLSLEEICRKVAELGYDYTELSPRPDFLSWWTRPKIYPERIASFKKALKDHGVTLATLQPIYRWSSPYQDEWDRAIDNWKRAIEIAVEMDCAMLVSEFGHGGSPERSQNDRSGLHRPETCEAQFFHAMEILVPILEREGIMLSLEADPEDWLEEIAPAIDIIKTINSPMVRASFIAPHTFYYGSDMAQLPHLTLQCLDPFLLIRYRARPFALVTLGLPDPAPQRFRSAADLRRDRTDRRPLRRMFAFVLEHHPNRALAHFRGVFG